MKTQKFDISKLPLLANMSLILLTDCYESLLDAEIAVIHLTQDCHLPKAIKIMGIIEHLMKKVPIISKKEGIAIMDAHIIKRFYELYAKKTDLLGNNTHKTKGK